MLEAVLIIIGLAIGLLVITGLVAAIARWFE